MTPQQAKALLALIADLYLLASEPPPPVAMPSTNGQQTAAEPVAAR